MVIGGAGGSQIPTSVIQCERGDVEGEREGGRRAKIRGEIVVREGDVEGGREGGREEGKD